MGEQESLSNVLDSVPHWKSGTKPSLREQEANKTRKAEPFRLTPANV